jgi:hypothetical protein
MAEDPTPTPAPAPAPEPRQREADLRAELAAERVAHRGTTEKVTALTADLEKVRGEIETKVKAAEDKILPKLTKLQKKLVESELKVQAASLDLQDPDLILHPLLDRSAIQVSDEGEVSGVKEALEKLKTAKPEWFKKPAAAAATTTTTTATTGGAAPSPSSSAPTITNVKDMTKEQYDAFRKEQLRRIRQAS